MDTKIRCDKLKINQLSEKVFQWYLGYLNTIDNRDIKSYVDYLSNDCIMQINNNPPVNGKDQIISHLNSLWSLYKEDAHDLLNIYGNDLSFPSEIVNHFTLHDGKEIAVNVVACTDRNEDGLLTSVRLCRFFTFIF